jgi:hypothetical protein
MRFLVTKRVTITVEPKSIVIVSPMQLEAASEYLKAVKESKKKKLNADDTTE